MSNQVEANTETLLRLPTSVVAHAHARVCICVFHFLPTGQLFHREIASHTESGSTPQSIVAQTHIIRVKSQAFVSRVPPNDKPTL
jgi:hypothetical protein